MLSAAGVTAVAALLADFTWDPFCVRGCSTPNPIVFAVVIDVSDQIDGARLEMIRSFVNKHLRELPEGSRLIIYMLASQEGPLRMVSPPLVKPRPIELANILTDPRPILEKDNERFSTGIDDAFATIRATKGSPLSPILEGLLALSGDPAFLALPNRQVLLVSDLVAKSNCIDQFSTNYAFKALQGREELSGLTAFRRARIWIKQLRFNTKHQTPQLIDFWRAYFDHAEFEVVDWTAL